MREPPLTRRRRLASLDEDDGPTWSEADLARFAHDATEAERRRDQAQVDEGQHLLAALVTDDEHEVSWRDLLARFMADKFRKGK